VIDETKVKAVYDYLQEEFKGCAVRDRYESGRMVQIFIIETGQANHKAVVSEEFLEDHEAAAIPVALRRFLLAEHLRECKDPILVTTRGLELA
jgi:hypothetical protein